jgi:transcriptional regulator with XRE-family HTH domain
MTGIKQPTLSRIEHGRVPELPNLVKLAAALNALITIEPSGKASIALI